MDSGSAQRDLSPNGHTVVVRQQRGMDDRMYGLQDVIRDQLKTYPITMVGSMTALTAIFAALLTIIT